MVINLYRVVDKMHEIFSWQLIDMAANIGGQKYSIFEVLQPSTD